MIKKCGILAAWAIALYVLQTSLLPLVAWRGVSTDFMLLLTVSFGFLRGARFGVLMGFCAGLLQDLGSGTFLGINVFNLMVLGFLCGKFSDKVFKDQFFLPIMAAVAAAAIDYVMTAAFVFLLGYPFDFAAHVRANFLPTIFWQVIFAYPVHLITYKIDQCLQDKNI